MDDWPALSNHDAAKEAHMLRRLVAILFVVGSCGWQLSAVAPAVAEGTAAEHTAAPTLTGRIVAVGIPGAAGVSAVGVFHAGGPIHDKPEFAAYTEPGNVLDPSRVLVVSSSNFGAPLAIPDQPAGSVLSLDV